MAVRLPRLAGRQSSRRGFSSRREAQRERERLGQGAPRRGPRFARGPRRLLATLPARPPPLPGERLLAGLPPPRRAAHPPPPRPPQAHVADRAGVRDWLVELSRDRRVGTQDAQQRAEGAGGVPQPRRLRGAAPGQPGRIRPGAAARAHRARLPAPARDRRLPGRVHELPAAGGDAHRHRDADLRGARAERRRPRRARRDRRRRARARTTAPSAPPRATGSGAWRSTRISPSCSPGTPRDASRRRPSRPTACSCSSRPSARPATTRAARPSKPTVRPIDRGTVSRAWHKDARTVRAGRPSG